MSNLERPDQATAGTASASSSVNQCPKKLWVELEHLTKFVDDYQQVHPAALTPFRITFGNGSQVVSQLDQNGFARFDDIPDGPVSVEYEPDIDKEIAELKQQLQQGLNEILDIERQEYERLDKELEDARVFGFDFPGSNAIARTAKYTWAAAKGVWNGFTGLLDFAWNVLKGSGKALVWLGERVNPITAPEKFREDVEALKQKYAELKRFANEDLEAYVILMTEADTYKILLSFATDFIALQHSLELTEAGGELAFDLILTIVTGGAGGAASVRHVGKLKKLKAIIDKLVDAIKRKKRRKKDVTDRPNRRILTKLEPRWVPCFCPYRNDKWGKMSRDEKNDYLKEYNKQLMKQQDAINEMTADEYLAARDAYKEFGRNPLSDELQSDFRQDFEEDITRNIQTSLERQGMDPDLARKEASLRAEGVMKKLAALHNPDQVAGGWNDPNPTGMGRSDVNSAIGGSWPHNDRLATMDEQAKLARQSGNGNVKLNVRLKVCTSRESCP
jgi:hypothetical protein